MSNPLLQAFFSPILFILLLTGLIVGIGLAVLRKRSILSTVAAVETAALIMYLCVFLLAAAPIIGIAASLGLLVFVVVVWRAGWLAPDTNAILVACLVLCGVILLAG